MNVDVLTIVLVVLVVAAIWLVIEVAVTVRKARPVLSSVQKTVDDVQPVIKNVNQLVEEAKPLITDAVNLNVSNRSSLVNIAYMALAIEDGTGFDEERASGAPVSVHFKDPSMPSPAALADAVVKQVSAFEWMKRSKVPFERMGYTDEEIERLMADMRTYDAIALFDQRVASEMSGNAVQGQAR